uniref:Uncharacterized protein n=1 Tax=Arundo donax TaxID=35708 RepID=A0A0A8Y2P9_ARUDO
MYVRLWKAYHIKSLALELGGSLIGKEILLGLN